LGVRRVCLQGRRAGRQAGARAGRQAGGLLLWAAGTRFDAPPPCCCRDVKPANFLLVDRREPDESGGALDFELVLTDFGISERYGCAAGCAGPVASERQRAESASSYAVLQCDGTMQCRGVCMSTCSQF